MKKIVVIGGGAGGLELATQLGDKLGAGKKAEVILIDKNSYHIWKPLLHEVAAGTLDEKIDNISYATQAKQHGFIFQQGTFVDLDRDAKQVSFVLENEESLKIEYDILAMAIGSTSNDFGTPGVKEHCIFLDDQNAAIKLRETFIAKFTSFCLDSDNQIAIDNKEKIRIAIVGGGATGVELASELPNMVQSFMSVNGINIDYDFLDVTVVEAADRILPVLPETTSLEITQTLEQKGIRVLTKTMVTKAESNGLYPKEGDTIKADMMIWTAGVKAPDFLKDIAGLESSRSNQLVVKPTLQSSRDETIFVIGDCAYALQANGRPSPPSAQAAHQMAQVCAYNIEKQLTNQVLKTFKYNDKGTIISLYDTAQGVVTLVGNRKMSVKGLLALFIYRMLYRLHQTSLLGIFKMLRVAKTSKEMQKIKSNFALNKKY